MAKELYIYSPLYDFTAESAVKALNGVSNDEDLTIRMNTPGGNVLAGWSIISKLSERTGKTSVIIDGQASSMGAIMLMFADEVTANDTSLIMFHKAAYSSWYEPNDREKQILKNINAQFQEKLTKKVEGKPGAQKFLDKLFEADVRNDVDITPVEAKKLGIVDEIKTLEPKAYDFSIQVCAIHETESPKPWAHNNNLNNHSMNLAELKAKHPELYAEIYGLGEKSGVNAERDRVGAWLAFAEVDVTAVTKGIKDGENISQTAMAEFAAKAMKSQRSGDHEKDNPDGTKTPSDGKTEEELKAEAQEKEAAEALKKIGL